MRKFNNTMLISTAALAAAVFVSNPAASQNRRASLAERVAEIELQLADTQPDDSRQALTDLVFEVKQLQEEVRQLRGQLEEQRFEITSLRDSQRDQYLELDRRLTTRPAATGAGSGEQQLGYPYDPTVPAPVNIENGAPVQSTQTTVGVDAGDTSVTTGSIGEPVVTRPPIDAGTETIALGDRPDIGTQVISDPAAEKAAYDEAFSALKDGRYAEAARLFDSFTTNFPASDLADNAQYWLGESYYVTRNYRVALEAFQTLLQRFPDSDKAGDSRLKIGLSYYSMKNWEAAERELEQVVSDFPDTTVARLASNRLRTMRIEGFIE